MIRFSFSRDSKIFFYKELDTEILARFHFTPDPPNVHKESDLAPPPPE